LACYESATFNTLNCNWDITGTQPTQPTLACYESATFNTTSCNWDVTGTQPAQPTLACYESATFNTTSCNWDVTGTQPAQPTIACYESATFNTTSCNWDVTGTQPAQPTLACYESATFNTTSCNWDVTGTQPAQPTLACYESATFNTTSCSWDVTGSQPTQPTLACYESATFNTTNCNWDVTGTQPTQPTLACYESATFNTTSCNWDVTGTQPAQPTLACYESATFNTTSCNWDVTGTQPAQPTLACYESATFNTTSCNWDVTGTQPAQPTLACYESATFNTTNCNWDVTGTQLSAPTAAVIQPTCSLSSGKITVTAPVVGETYTITGINSTIIQTNATGVFSTLPPGDYLLIANNGTCSSLPTAPITINAQPTVPNVTFDKTSVVNGSGSIGDTITYTFKVSNVGTTGVFNVTINDPLIQSTPIAVGNIAAGMVSVIEVNYTITQADVNAGIVNNQAAVAASTLCGTLTVLSDDGNPANGSNNVTVTQLTQSPSIEIVKTGLLDLSTGPSGTITYTFVIKNTGNITLSNVMLSDPLLGITGQAIIPTLIAGQVITVNASSTYTVLSSDVDAGFVANTAIVTANTASGITVNGTGTVITPLTKNNNIGLIKTGEFQDENGDGFAQAGETIRYNFRITNTGNTILYNVTVQDTYLVGIKMFGNPISTLAPSEVNDTVYFAVYTLTQDDISAGSVTNQASVKGFDSVGNLVTQRNSDHSNNIEQNPTVVILNGCTIVVYNLVSPLLAEYEFLTIQGIECYPSNTIEIYNRWGVQVFEAKEYDNKNNVFRGESNGRFIMNQSAELPEGTYYYILNYIDGSSNKSKSGFIHLTR
jgi:uncharacterized repeat protein (TIGR01451 family)